MLLALMSEDNSLWHELARIVPKTNCRRISGTSLLARSCMLNLRHLALVVRTLEYMDKREASNIIAQLRFVCYGAVCSRSDRLSLSGASQLLGKSRIKWAMVCAWLDSTLWKIDLCAIITMISTTKN